MTAVVVMMPRPVVIMMPIPWRRIDADSNGGRRIVVRIVRIGRRHGYAPAQSDSRERRGG
jgi:hypothetical protein